MKQSYEANKAIRRDWGTVNPVTKVIPDKRRKKKERDAKKEARNY